MDQGTNISPLKRRNVLVSSSAEGQKPTKPKCDSREKKCVLVRALKGVFNSKKPQFKEGRKGDFY